MLGYCGLEVAWLSQLAQVFSFECIKTSFKNVNIEQQAPLKIYAYHWLSHTNM